MNFKEDPNVLKSTKIYKCGPVPFRYALRHIPKTEDPSMPYLACRENMILNSDVWEVHCRYWCSYREKLADAEKEYQIKIDSEGDKT